MHILAREFGITIGLYFSASMNGILKVVMYTLIQVEHLEVQPASIFLCSHLKCAQDTCNGLLVTLFILYCVDLLQISAYL